MWTGYFETSIEDLTVLKKCDICLEECIVSATHKVHAHFERFVGMSCSATGVIGQRVVASILSLYNFGYLNLKRIQRELFFIFSFSFVLFIMFIIL